MKPIFAEELYSFFAMLILGVCVGILFDVFRSIRRVVVKRSIAVHVSDALFWIITLFMTIKILYIFNDGRLRACLITASFLGGLLYFLTLSRPFIYLFSSILKIFLKIFKFIFKILLTPVHFLYKILLVAFEGILRNIKKLKISFKRKKNKKRGCRNDRERKEKGNNSHRGSLFGGRFFVGKRSNAAAEDKRKQRRNRKLKRTNSPAAEKA